MSVRPRRVEYPVNTGDPRRTRGLDMSRYERTQYFEALCRLRATSAEGLDVDRRPVISIDDAIAYAEAVMAASEAEAEEAQVHEELAAQQESPALSDPRD
jgi:hypothetical protein